MNIWVEKIKKEAKRLPLDDVKAFVLDIIYGLTDYVFSHEKVLEIQKEWEVLFENLKPESGVILVSNDYVKEIKEKGGFSSNSEVKRLFDQGAVRLRIGKKALIVKIKK